MDSTEQIYSKLAEEGLIAVHYGGELKGNLDPTNLEVRKNPENYKKKAKHVLTRFKQCCNKGAIVFADYSNPQYVNLQKKACIGIVSEGTDFDAVLYHGRQDYPDGLIYEQVKLLNFKTFSYGQIESFLAIHPRGGTLVHWKEAEDIVKFVYRRELGFPIDLNKITFEVLFPAQQEVLCSEFLRLKAPAELRINYLLLPVGRGMKTIDIDGASRNVHLMAQVSFTTQEREIIAKIDDMKELALNCGGPKKMVQVYFGPEEVRGLVKNNSSIEFFSLEEVFSSMIETGILDDMLGIRLR